MLKGVVIGFFCFISFLILHVIIFHNREIKCRFLTLVMIFYALVPFYILLYIIIPADALVLISADPRVMPGTVIGLSQVFNFFIGLAIYHLLFFGYCQFYFLLDRSVSVRTMIELMQHPQKKMTKEEIKKAYDFDDFISRRLKHMLDSKYITQESSYYTNTAKGRLLAKVFRFLKEYLRLGIGG
ncbi:MAG: hypothetical protein Q8O30_05420 [Candidatus Omnitrophota bacterium]|nr:hypothetical protein [Candidatus Omnitrophota bacterium]